MYNINHNKVLVRMDGSRRFVRKILSPSDQLNQDERNALPSPMQSNDTGPAVGGVLDVVLTAGVGTEASDNTSYLVGMQQCTDNQMETSGEGFDDKVTHDDSAQHGGVESSVPIDNVLVPTARRPKRDKRPNVKYSAEEHDLATVSASKGRLLLSGLYVKQGRLTDRRC